MVRSGLLAQLVGHRRARVAGQFGNLPSDRPSAYRAQMNDSSAAGVGRGVAVLALFPSETAGLESLDAGNGNPQSVDQRLLLGVGVGSQAVLAAGPRVGQLMGLSVRVCQEFVLRVVVLRGGHGPAGLTCFSQLASQPGDPILRGAQHDPQGVFANVWRKGGKSQIRGASFVGGLPSFPENGESDGSSGRVDLVHDRGQRHLAVRGDYEPSGADVSARVGHQTKGVFAVRPEVEVNINDYGLVGSTRPPR